MENRQTPNKTPSKFFENLPKEIRDAVNKKNQMQGSPFYCLPNHTTPPSGLIKIKNPFEAAINDQLHKHIFSPTVFAETSTTPRRSDKFKWTIDDVSSLKPAHIDVSTIAQFETTTSEDDIRIQAKIEKYFSETHIVPSPFTEEINVAPLLPEHTDNTSPPVDNQPAGEMCNVWTQTVLSLPPNLPEEIENILKPYFTFTEDQRRQSVDMNSSLCRRLFHFESPRYSEEEAEHSLHEHDLSSVGSPIINTQESEKRKRNFDSSPDAVNLIPVEISPIHNSSPRKLNNCPISPIISFDLDHEQLRSNNVNYEEQASSSISPINLPQKLLGQSFAKMDSTGHMSVDNSFNMAPENDLLVHDHTNLSESPVRTNEFMENSCNWELEYNSISGMTTRPIRRSLFDVEHENAEQMDVSNLTTPKSKIINSQRKKLSDSFHLNETTSDEEEIINFEYQNDDGNNQMKKRLNFCDKSDVTDGTDFNIGCSQNTQDTGYNTGTEISNKLNYSKDEEDMCISDESDHSVPVESNKDNRNHIFASTPSRRYFCNLKK